jgi:phytoene dehydrogenase-like protein
MAALPARPTIAAGPSRHLYDVIVVGGQLGGPLCAALLAKRKSRVLYVDHDGLGAGYEHGGWLLPYAPFVSPPLKAMPTVEEALHELGLNTTIQRGLRTFQPELQLIFERHRLDLPGDSARRKNELSREFGQAGAQVHDQLGKLVAQHESGDRLLKEHQDLPPVGWFSRWRLRRALSGRPGLEQAPALDDAEGPARLLRGLWPFLTWLDAPPSALAQTRPLSQVLRGPSHWPGGREGLRELLLKKLQDLGGDVLTRETSDTWVAESLSFEGRKLVGIQLLKSTQVYKAAAVVAATDAGAIRRLIPEKKRHRGLTELLDQVEIRRLLFTVNWVVPERLLPRGMGELMLLEATDELGPVLVQVEPARRPGGAEDPKLRTVCAGAFVPASARELGEEHLVSLKARLERRLEQLIPFARDALEVSSAPYLDASGVRGSRLLPHPLLSVDTEAFAGITGLPPRTPVKNLFLASREVLPGLGFEGELLAGVRAARLVQQALHKTNPLGR